MAYNVIKYEVEDRILTLTMNRPEKLNAFTDEMRRELCDAYSRADADDDIRAVILTGEGRGFCAGADISSGNVFNHGDQVPRDGGGLLTLRMFDCLKPIIAAVNGPAVGVGATMTLAADIRLASENARFGFVFARRGIVPEAASTWFLPRVVGVSRALEWTFSGRVFPASEALEAGLVRQVLPADQLLARAREIAAEIRDNTSAVSVAMTRQMIWKLLGADHPMEAHKLDSRAVPALGQKADAQEGVTSFLEKRPAHFTLGPSKDMPAFYPWWKDRVFE